MSFYDRNLTTKMPPPSGTRGSPYARVLHLLGRQVDEAARADLERMRDTLEADRGRRLGPRALERLAAIETANPEPVEMAQEGTSWST